jgi:16S rRNA (adenine1518-N6/adenine1519-N6)-dimethyltransferase
MHLSQKKSLGQVFLKDSSPCQKIVTNLKDYEFDVIMEIGPGRGILTEQLLKLEKPVYAIEKDDRFSAFLKEKFAEPKLEIINSDILKLNWQSDPRLSHKALVIVGNIPYNISTPILRQVIGSFHNVKAAIFMTQWEYAQRVCAAPGSKIFGSLSVFIQLRATPRMLFKVDRSSFRPVPKVDSAVFSLTKAALPVEGELLDLTERICRRVFSQRRKQLKSSLKDVMSRIDSTNICPIDLRLRPEVLPPTDFLKLAAFIRLHLDPQNKYSENLGL